MWVAKVVPDVNTGGTSQRLPANTSRAQVKGVRAQVEDAILAGLCDTEHLLRALAQPVVAYTLISLRQAESAH